MFAFKYVIQLGMEGLETMDKAVWTKKILHVFCDLCIKNINMRMKPNTHFDKVS